MSRLRLSVLIPSYNEAENIAACLDAVRESAARAGGAEVLVIDNASTDGTADIARTRGVRVLESPSGRFPSIAAQRNAGARESSGDILAFVDSDTVVPAEWLERAARFFASGFRGALGFAEKAPDTASWVGRVWASRQARRREAEADVDYLPSGNLLVDREAFLGVGAFDESLPTGEDKDLSLRLKRAGYRVVSLPEPCVIHRGCERTLREFLRKEFWRQSHTLRLARKGGWRPRTLRHPLLSAWHVLAPLVFAASCALPLARIGAPLVLLLWMGPSAAIAWARRTSGRPTDAVLLFLLTWLRWHAAGVALVWQVVTSDAFRSP
jgi:glycosyltransferase involved in cell wall biosynthesis